VTREQRHHVVVLDSPGVVYEEWPCEPALRPWVAVHWRIRATADAEFRVLPDGCMDVIGDDVVGSFPVAEVFTLGRGAVTTGTRLHPGAFPALTGVPASELVGLDVPLRQLLPAGSSLRSLARDAGPPDPVVAAAWALPDLRSLRRETGYGERQLRRRVAAATGHSPKRLQRIRRMQQVLRAGRGRSWAESAQEHGYYDEAHMAHDIKALAGATPHVLV
jgi:AraC-like DNA-binding protein